MCDEDQIEIPQSFIALFVDPGRQKPNASSDVVAGHYVLCEDMAVMLVEAAGNMNFSFGISEREVLQRILEGPVNEEAVVAAAEAVCVVHSFAKLVNCAQPEAAIVAELLSP